MKATMSVFASSNDVRLAESLSMTARDCAEGSDGKGVDSIVGPDHTAAMLSSGTLSCMQGQSG